MTHLESENEDGPYASQEEALLTDLAWPVHPVRLSSDREHLEMVLRTNWKDEPTRRRRVPDEGLLQMFCELARNGLSKNQRRQQVLQFAKRYGLLGLCKQHRHPVASCIEPGCGLWRWEHGHGKDMGLREAIEDWTLWARRFRGTMAIARLIRRYRPLNPGDVEDTFARLDHARCQMMRDVLREPPPSKVTKLQDDGSYCPVEQREWERQPHDVEVGYLQEWLNYLLSIAAVNRRVVSGKGHQLLAIADAYHERCPLFGALVYYFVRRPERVKAAGK